MHDFKLPDLAFTSDASSNNQINHFCKWSHVQASLSRCVCLASLACVVQRSAQTQPFMMPPGGSDCSSKIGGGLRERWQEQRLSGFQSSSFSAVGLRCFSKTRLKVHSPSGSLGRWQHAASTHSYRWPARWDDQVQPGSMSPYVTQCLASCSCSTGGEEAAPGRSALYGQKMKL